MKHVDLDKMHNVDPDAVATTAFDVLQRLETQPSHVQVTAVAALFLGLCEHYRVDAQDVMGTTKNLLASPRAEQSHELRAWKMYLKHEMKRG